MRQLVVVTEEDAKASAEVKDEDLMVNNFRPPVPMGNRQLREM